MGLAEVGEKGKSMSDKSIRFFVPRTYMVAGVWVKKLHIH